MSRFEVNKYVSMNPDAFGMSKYQELYRSQHSKFIHGSWLLREDLGRDVTIDEIEYTIWGLWDVINARYFVMLLPKKGGPFRIEESKVVAHALGYSRMRNFVTGEEIQWQFPRRKDWTYLGPQQPKVEVVEDTTERDEDDPEFVSYEEEEEVYIDPLIKALQDDITDDGDYAATSN